MSKSFIKIPSFLGFHPDISPLELRVLMALIFWSGINTQEPGHIKYGAEKLGKQINIGRESCRKALYKLANLKLISINHRGNLTNESYGISNDIELTLDAGIEFLRNGGSAEAGSLPLNKAGNLHLKDAGLPSDLYLNEAGDLHLKTPDLPLNWVDLPLNKAGHIDDRFKININLNKIQRARAHSETDDETSVRSKPNGGQAAESSAEEVQASNQTELEDFCLVSAFFEAFPGLSAWVNIARAGGYIAIQPIGKMGESRLNTVWTDVSGWFELRGVKLVYYPANQKLKGIILNREAA